MTLAVYHGCKALNKKMIFQFEVVASILPMRVVRLAREAERKKSGRNLLKACEPHV